MSRNTLKLDTSGFEQYLVRLARLEHANAKKSVEEALNKVADKVSQDTIAAMAASNLPAGGIYSQGDTKESIVTDSRVTWEGMVASIPVGFDFSKPGAGGYLITGTPRMQPDKALHRMYKQKKYMRTIQQEIGDTLLDHIIRAEMEGK